VWLREDQVTSSITVGLHRAQAAAGRQAGARAAALVAQMARTLCEVLYPAFLPKLRILIPRASSGINTAPGAVSSSGE
jgi:hypothetical protein